MPCDVVARPLLKCAMSITYYKYFGIYVDVLNKRVVINISMLLFCLFDEHFERLSSLVKVTDKSTFTTTVSEVVARPLAKLTMLRTYNGYFGACIDVLNKRVVINISMLLFCLFDEHFERLSSPIRSIDTSTLRAPFAFSCEVVVWPLWELAVNPTDDGYGCVCVDILCKRVII